MTMHQLLEEHQTQVDLVEYRPDSCAHCDGGKRSLRPRQLIRRLVRFIEDRVVHREPIVVILWACLDCHRSFRHLPPFLEPKMRFITPTIVEKASEVLSRQRKPYRKTALNEAPNRTRINYDKKNWAFSHTSVWRWIQWMANFFCIFLSINPQTATDIENDSFEFSPFQANEPQYMESLYLARRLWLAQTLTS